MDGDSQGVEDGSAGRGIARSNATERPSGSSSNDHRDLFSGTQIRASHILIKVDPDACGREGKGQAKTLQIKKDIQNGQSTFAAAANKFSQDEANSGGAGGDLDYFTLEHRIRRGIHRRRVQAQEGRDLRPGRDSLRLPPDPGDRPQGGQAASTSSRTSPTSARNTATSSSERRQRRAAAGQDRHQADAQGPLPLRAPPATAAARRTGRRTLRDASTAPKRLSGASLATRSASTDPIRSSRPRRAGRRSGERSRRSRRAARCGDRAESAPAGGCRRGRGRSGAGGRRG